jgi:hypothetical protein
MLLIVTSAAAQKLDSDHDGLPDDFEDALLQQFAPSLRIAMDDCSIRPASFEPGITVPQVIADDGTLYGQAKPVPGAPHEIELHFYHLWRRDCGRLGHPLDAEHVATLLRLEDPDRPSDARSWRAAYWYAAAHEDTVCDASHLAHASTLDAVTHGAKVWISSGKHGSFLTEKMCSHGCGGDRCEHMVELRNSTIVNLGELHAPMHGAVWSTSAAWPGPLRDKMTRSDFSPERISRLDRLRDREIAWANPSKRPAQAAILGGNSAVDGVVTGGDSTGKALSIAGEQSGSALETATQHTGHALGKSWHAVRKALGNEPKEPKAHP